MFLPGIKHHVDSTYDGPDIQLFSIQNHLPFF